MKFTLSFKTPDVLDQLDEDITDLETLRLANQTVKKFVEYGEYITVQFDTETQSAVVRELA